MAGGKRDGAGRPALKKGQHRIAYNVRLAPEIVKWLRSLPRGKATETIEKLLKEEMQK